MRVSCPSCGTTYALPAQHAKPGVKARCKRCGLVFPAVPEAEAAVEATDVSGEAAPAAPETAEELPANISAPIGPTGLSAKAPSHAPEGLAVPESVPGLSAADGPRLDPGFVAPPDAHPAAAPDALPSVPDDPPAAPGAGLVEASDTFDPFGDLGDLGGDAPGWGEPAAGDAQPAGASAAPDADDPFSDIDVETEEAGAGWEVAPSAPPPEPARGPVGVSAIRAQSMAPAAAAPASLETDAPSPETPKGWRLRREDRGDVLSFRDLESVRGWLLANSGIEVSLSTDGRSWKSPEEILGLVPASRSAGRAAAGSRAAPRRGPTTRPQVDRAGAGWLLAMAVSTVLLLATSSVTVQNLGIADLSDVVPYPALGLDRFLVAGGGASVDERGLTPEERYGRQLALGDDARRRGRLIDATIAYQLALESFEGREALDGLIRAYEGLGDTARAAETKQRLERLRDPRSRGGGSGDG
jgi:predicted Zn finger-like uncharacterized protein